MKVGETTYRRNSRHLLRTNEDLPLDESAGQCELDVRIKDDAQAWESTGTVDEVESSPSGNLQCDPSLCKVWKRGDRLRKQTVFFKAE